ncbi:hypothetical protein LUZ60_003772 [Juncus effusus]|nr:hypothetical protein LUZ60_003772 [Juncus effusus]
MGIDYYKLLEVDRGASEEDLRRAYRRLAMKWHPDKNPSDESYAESAFKQISEAYDVLSDPQKRSIYDQYGEEGLKSSNQMPPPHHSSSTGFKFNPQSAVEIFSQVFGSPNPNPRTGGFISEESLRGFRGEGLRKVVPQIEKTLVCSLEELYKGGSKKMKISRDVMDSNSKPATEEEILTIDIKPGWKKGTRITFPSKFTSRNSIYGDLVFLIDEKPHPVFKCEGNDLFYTHSVSLLEALTGFTVKLTTLDGRDLEIPIRSVVSPNYEEVVQGEGMVIGKEGRKGNLWIRFRIEFPARLSEEQKEGIRELLS